MDIESSKPTIVLVHGALEDSSIWHLVIPRLQRDGYPVFVFSNPVIAKTDVSTPMAISHTAIKPSPPA